MMDDITNLPFVAHFFTEMKLRETELAFVIGILAARKRRRNLVESVGSNKKLPRVTQAMTPGDMFPCAG